MHFLPFMLNCTYIYSSFSCQLEINYYYYYYQTQWNAEIVSRLTTAPETRPGALVEDKYAIAVINNGKTVGNVPKFSKKQSSSF